MRDFVGVPIVQETYMQRMRTEPCVPQVTCPAIDGNHVVNPFYAQGISNK